MPVGILWERKDRSCNLYFYTFKRREKFPSILHCLSWLWLSSSHCSGKHNNCMAVQSQDTPSLSTWQKNGPWHYSLWRNEQEPTAPQYSIYRENVNYDRFKRLSLFFFFFGRMCVSLSMNRFNNWHDVNRIRERRLQFLLIIICSRNLIWVVDFGWWPIMTWLFYLKLTRLSTCQSAPKK